MLDKLKIRNVIIYLMIILMTFCFCNIEILGNNFIFFVPWVLFCFMNNKKYAIISFVVSFFCIGKISSWFYLVFIGLASSFFVFKYFIKLYKNEVGKCILIYDFLSVFLCGLCSLFIKEAGNLIYCFFSGVISFWVMRGFYNLYFCFKGQEDINCYKNSSFVLFMLGVISLGLNLEFGVIDLGLIFAVFMAFIAGKVGKEEGILYTFLISVLLVLIREFDVSLLLFIGVSIFSSLFNRVSKAMIFLSYIAIVVFVMYYFNIDYLEGVNYFLGALMYLLIPLKNNVLVGKEEFVEKIKKENKKNRREIEEKINKIEQVFSLTYNKLNIQGRMKKNDRVLLYEELNIFNDILRGLSKDLDNSCDKFNYKIERALYKYGLDVLKINVNKNIIREVCVFVSVRCDKDEIEKIVVPVISRIMKVCFKVGSLKYNDVFGYYDIELVNSVSVNFKFGVAQRAKNGRVCGDSYLVFESDECKLFLLSDGMGYGEEAKERSKLAINLFKNYIDIGFSVENSIKSLNCILKGEFSKEGYTTFDLFVYDKYQNKSYFCKNGACDSYILKNNEVVVIEGNDLPLGIIDRIESNIHSVNLENNDYIIMMSDGVSESCLRKCSSKDPQKMAKEIIDRQKDVVDDASVIVINIKS